jgi:DNA transformation protein
VAVSESFLAFVLEQLDSIRDVTSRRMFGGVGLYAGEWFFAVIDNDTLFFKVDDLTRPKYRKRRMTAFAPMPGKPGMEGYYQVPLSVLEDAGELGQWAREAVTVAQRAPTRRRAPRPRRQPRTED